MLDPTFNGKNILEQGNTNWPAAGRPGDQQGDGRRPSSRRPTSARQTWADIDKQVTGQAPAIPWIWDKQPIIQSANVNGVITRSTPSGTCPGPR